MSTIPILDIRDPKTTAELRAVATDPRLRRAVWNAMRALGYTDNQISFNEHAKGRHPSTCQATETGFNCIGPSGKSHHWILDQYNTIEKTIIDSGLLEPLSEDAPFIGQVITEAAALDALPEGSLIGSVKINPNWPDVFMHTGNKNQPWLHLDPSDRDDGEATLFSDELLRWHCSGSATILHLGIV